MYPALKIIFHVGRDDQRRDDVGDDSHAGTAYEKNPGQTYDGRIHIQIISYAAAHPGDLPVVGIPVKSFFSFCSHKSFTNRAKITIFPDYTSLKRSSRLMDAFTMPLCTDSPSPIDVTIIKRRECDGLWFFEILNASSLFRSFRS